MRTKRTIRMLVTGIVGAGLIGAGLVVATPTAAVAETKQLPVAEYVKTVCAAMREVKNVEDFIFENAKRRGPVKFAASQEQALDYMTDYQNVWANASATFTATSPKVRNGEKIEKLFAAYATTAVEGIQKAVDAFKAVDPATPQFMMAFNRLAGAAADIRSVPADPVEMITDRSVRKAFNREKTCADLFPSLIDPEGRFTSFPASGPFAFAMTEHPDPDGNLWFLQLIANKVVKIDTQAAALTDFTGPAGFPTTTAVTVGPDGNLWFTVRNGSAPLRSAASAAAQVGKLDRETGVVTLVPTPNAYPNGITAGPDGNLWFVDGLGPVGQVGKLDPATGAVTVFPIPTAGAIAYTITAGPDGNLWFTEPNKSQIGRVDPDTGIVTEFPVPTTGNLYGITAGPDGNVWFTQQTSNQIGMIDPDGHFTMFSVPTPAAGLLGITTGCDGSLWFTENNANKIGKIDPDTGAVTEYLVPTANAEPAYIAAVSDGSVWFTDEITNSIWKFDTGAVAKLKNGKVLKACLKPPKA